jgi:signal transduction histidine kinase
LKARTYLALMALAVLVPIGLFSVLALDMLLRAEREAALRGLQETSRAAALAVDRELSIAEARARTLATSRSLARGDFEEFHRRASLVNEEGRTWTVLFDEDGQQLVNTRVPYGMPLPRRSHPERGRAVLEDGRMRVTDLVRGPLVDDHVLAIDVPVTIDGKRRYVLGQAFLASQFDSVIRSSNIPAGWIIGIFDQKGISIARNLGGPQMVGKPVRQELFDASRRASEGVLQHLTREHIHVYDAYTRSALSGWTIAVGAPVETIEASARNAVRMVALGFGAALLCAVVLAGLFSRRFMNSIDRATASAAALGRGEMPREFSSGVQEFERLHAALLSAGQILGRETESRARAEAERTALFASEQEARRLAETQNRAKDQFLAMLGHELRNPLGAISSAIALLDHPAAPADTSQRALAVIRRQSAHLGRIVDDLLDLSRLMKGKVVLVRQRMDLAQAVSDCLQGIQTTGRTALHDIRLQTMPVPVEADPTRIEQIIGNLIGNAIKYTPAGGRIDVEVGSAGGSAVLTVRDSGIGIPPDLLGQVFEVFVQGPGSLDRSQGGLGIGLALVRQLVRLHGGEVSAASEGLGHGSCFIVRLPLAQEESGTEHSDEHGPGSGMTMAASRGGWRGNAADAGRSTAGGSA